MRLIRLKHQSSIVIPPHKLLPRRRARLAVSIRVVRSNEARPVALNDCDDGVIDATFLVRVGSAAVDVVWAE